MGQHFWESKLETLHILPLHEDREVPMEAGGDDMESAAEPDAKTDEPTAAPLPASAPGAEPAVEPTAEPAAEADEAAAPAATHSATNEMAPAPTDEAAPPPEEPAAAADEPMAAADELAASADEPIAAPIAEPSKPHLRLSDVEEDADEPRREFRSPENAAKSVRTLPPIAGVSGLRLSEVRKDLREIERTMASEVSARPARAAVRCVA